jgi:hypothetical protein
LYQSVSAQTEVKIFRPAISIASFNRDGLKSKKSLQAGKTGIQA